MSRTEALIFSPCILCSGILGYLLVHRLWIWPFFLSPLRSIPGPPLGHPIFGQSLVIVRSESGIPQREWVKQYGSVIRIVGPVGIERLIFMKPDALHHILVKHWLEYPRVCGVSMHGLCFN